MIVRRAVERRAFELFGAELEAELIYFVTCNGLVSRSHCFKFFKYFREQMQAFRQIALLTFCILGNRFAFYELFY